MAWRADQPNQLRCALCIDNDCGRVRGDVCIHDLGLHGRTATLYQKGGSRYRC